MTISKIGMRPDKVARRKNKSRKPKSPNQNSPVNITSSEFRGSPSLDDIELIAATGHPSDEFNVVDIGEIAERCVLEEIGGDVDVDDLNINLDFDTLEFDEDPESLFLITPSLKLTIEEEYKICEIEAAKDLLIKSFSQTILENVPNIQEYVSLCLYSVALGVTFDFKAGQVFTIWSQCRYFRINTAFITIVQLTNFFREAIISDMMFGGHLNIALSHLEVFSHIPLPLKVKLFLSSLGSVDILKRYINFKILDRCMKIT